jgi:hypothetical protein
MADLRMLPVWVPGYRRGLLASDLVAGLIVWSVVVPQCVSGSPGRCSNRSPWAAR